MIADSQRLPARWFGGEFSPPQVSEVEWLRAAFDGDAKAGIEILPGQPSDGDAPVPVETRVQWMTRLFPDRAIRVAADGVGESTLVPELARRIDPAQLRADILGYWDEIPAAVRSDYLIRVAIVGPESVGKSTLARDLAEHLGGRDVQEYAREAYPWGDPTFRARPEHMVEICAGHGRCIRGAEQSADRYLFSDTEAITTLVWSESYLGEVPREVVEAARDQQFDLFLLLDLDVPWVADGVRTWEHGRQAQFEHVRNELEARGLPYTIISGGWSERFEASVQAILALGSPHAPMGCPGRFPVAEEEPLGWGARYSAE